MGKTSQQTMYGNSWNIRPGKKYYNTAAQFKELEQSPLLCEYTYYKMKLSLLYIPVLSDRG